MSGGPRRDDRGGGGGGAPPVSMDIQKRTLKVNELDDEVSKELLEELFLQVMQFFGLLKTNLLDCILILLFFFISIGWSGHSSCSKK